MQTYVQAVNHSVMVMNDADYFRKQYGIIDHELIDSCDLAIGDFTLVNSSYDIKAEHCMIAFPSLKTFTNMVVDKMEPFLDISSVWMCF